MLNLVTSVISLSTAFIFIHLRTARASFTTCTKCTTISFFASLMRKTMPRFVCHLCHPKSFCTVSNPFRPDSFQRMIVVRTLIPTNTLWITTSMLSQTSWVMCISPSWTSRSRFPRNKWEFWACYENPEFFPSIIGPCCAFFTIDSDIYAFTFWCCFASAVVPAAVIRTTTSRTTVICFIFFLCLMGTYSRVVRSCSDRL